MRIAILVALAMLCFGAQAEAQYWYPSHGYAWYPSHYGGGYYRAPFYGGGLPYRGYNGYHMADRPVYRAPAYRPPVRYQWYGGNSRAYLGGRGGGWGGEW